MPHPFTPSEQQQIFFVWVKTGHGSAVLTAVAGAGKSTSIIESLIYIPEEKSVGVVVFSADMAPELKAKVVALGEREGRAFRGVRVSTFHALGMGAIRKRLGAVPVTVDSGKIRRLMKARCTEADVAMYGDFVFRLVGLAKGEGIGVLTADTVDAYRALIAHHDLYLDSEDASEDRAIDLARKLLALSCKVALTGDIDFNDQLYLPLLWRLKLWQNDWLFIDEAQDTNPVRRAIAKLALRPGGRLVAVGDPKQAIFGFCHPPGTLVMTPKGHANIEDMREGDKVIIGSTGGDVAGWSGNAPIKEVHTYHHSGMLLTVSAAGRSVEMTPHHRVPVRVDADAAYYTYMMRRDGVYRVGHCKAYTSSGDFMLTFRYKREHADAAWLLAGHATKDAARVAEKALLLRVKGTTLQNMADVDVARMVTDEVEAIKILSEHGRMVDFPLMHPKVKHRISRNGPIVIEACNIMNGMRIAYYDKYQMRPGVRIGRSKQNFVWSPCDVTARHYSGPVYGISVPAIAQRSSYQSWPLYFGGTGQILVHNTGASHDSMDLLEREFNCAKLFLTVSYRCAQAVVRKAQRVVDYIQAAPGAPEGVDDARTLAEALTVLGPRDAILCRQVAPLITLAYTLLAEGRACKVLGREIGDGLVALIQRQKARGIDRLIEKLDNFSQREIANFMAKGQEQKAEGVADRLECIKVVINQLSENDRTIPALIAKISTLFADKADCLILSSIHKAKGKEYDVVAILRPELSPSKYARQDHQYQEELNLMYVRDTRAKRHIMELTTDTLEKLPVKQAA